MHSFFSFNEHSIYLAETGIDQLQNRDLIKSELRRRGFNIFPNSPLPNNANMFEEKVKEYLSQSFLAIHIFGYDQGDKIQGSDLSLVQFQNKIAAEFFDDSIKNGNKDKKKFGRAIWITPELMANTTEEKTSTEFFQSNVENYRGAEIVQTPLEVFKSIIHNKIAEFTEDSVKSIMHSTLKDQTSLSVYYIYDLIDAEAAIKILHSLPDSELNILPSVLEFDSDNIFLQHRNNLVKSDVLILYIKEADQSWLMSKLLDILKAPGYGKRKPYASKIALVDEKAIGYKSLLENHSFEVHAISENQSDYIHIFNNLSTA